MCDVIDVELNGRIRIDKRSVKYSRNRERGKRRYLAIIIPSLIVIIAILYIASLQSSDNNSISKGKVAPDIPIYLINGTKVMLSDFKGHKVLLWFITTWCSSCQAGAQIIATYYYKELVAKGVTILTVESYNNLGVQGPTLVDFMYLYGRGGKQNWLYGTTTQQATMLYNPNAYLDLYYLIDDSGVIVAQGVNLPSSLQSIVEAL